MKNFRGNKTNIIIGLCAIVLLMGIGFAGFSQTLQITDSSSSTNEWNVYISNAEVGSKSTNSTGTVTKAEGLEASFVTNLYSPGDSVVYNITVKNDGNVDATLDELNLNTTNSDSVILYSYEGIEKGDTLAQGDSITFTVTVEYDSTKTGTATEAQKKNSATLQLNFVQKTASSVVTPTETFTTADLKNKAVTSGDGLYADTYEEGRYVYKGASPDNYITFNGETAGWRIISVEADGTLKIMRNTSIGEMAWDAGNARDAGSNGAGGTYCANASSGYGCNAWAVSNNFVNGSYSGTVLLDASLNTYLNTTYKNSLTKSDYIQDHDYGIGSAIFANTDLAVQIASENSLTWTGTVGLMSVSDYIRSNTNETECGNYSLNQSNYNTCKSTTWIQDVVNSATNGWIWTMTARSANADYVFDVDSYGYVYSNNAYYSYGGVAPVLYLSSDIALSGEGTADTPFEIKIN